jgi:hypothetical protein
MADAGKKIATSISERLNRFWFATRQRLQILQAKTRWLWSLPTLILVVILSMTAVFSFTGAGSYINTYFFYNPMIKLRANWGLQPSLDPSIRVILVEDRSLAKMGRFPTYGEWYGIAKELFELGVEKVFMLGMLNLESEVGEIPERHSRGQFISGAVPYPYSNNLQAFPVGDIDARLLTLSKDDSNAKLSHADYVLTQHQAAHSSIDLLGHVNLLDNNAIELAFRVGEDRIIPNLSALVMDDLHWADGHLHSGDYRLPASFDNRFMIDFVDFKSVISSLIPVSAFYQPGYRSIKTDFSQAVVEKIAGAKYVVFVKEGYQGSRFVDTPFGQLPSFMSILSPMNSALNKFFLHRPMPDWWIMLGATPILVLLFSLSSAQISLIAGLFIVVGQLILGAWLLVQKGWVLPAAEVAFLGLSGWLIRLFHYTLKTVQEKLTLNRDLEMGRTVQSLFIPSELSGQIPGWEFKFLFQPYGAMSGDWVNVYQSPCQHARNDLLSLPLAMLSAKVPVQH